MDNVSTVGRSAKARVQRRIQDDGARTDPSVCTGSLVLGAAGLLTGYRATCHWSSIDQLSLLGAEPVRECVVRNRNRMTGAGVTSRIDFALSIAADLMGDDVAQEVQLQMEYDPEPPYQSGSPRTGPTVQVTRLRFPDLAQHLGFDLRVGFAILGSNQFFRRQRDQGQDQGVHHGRRDHAIGESVRWAAVIDP